MNKFLSKFVSAGVLSAATGAAPLPASAQNPLAFDPGTSMRSASATACSPDWTQFGLDGDNSRNAACETAITSANVGTLKQTWSFEATGNLDGGVASETGPNGPIIYAADSNGGLNAINGTTGQAIWSHYLSDYTGNNASKSRGTPAIAGDLLILGDRASATVLAVNKTTGALAWSTVVDTTQDTMITTSVTVNNGVVYSGVSASQEYWVTQTPGYQLNFAGSVVALDAATGKKIWQTQMVPLSAGYTGGAVWGSGFAISQSLNLLYVSTGNNYSVPDAATSCIAAAGSSKAGQDKCLPKNDDVDSLVALDLTTGVRKWARKLEGADTTDSNCGETDPVNPCTGTGSDFDSASGPNIFTATINGQATELVGLGQKSGSYFALNPASGALVWSVRAGRGSQQGGIMWGSAVDAQHVYVAENDDAGSQTSVLKTASGAVVRVKGGYFAALDVATGDIDWTTAGLGGTAKAPTGAISPMTVANGVVFGGTTSGNTLQAMDAASGQVLWSFKNPAGAWVSSGATVADGLVLSGEGPTLYAFALPQEGSTLSVSVGHPRIPYRKADLARSDIAFASHHKTGAGPSAAGQAPDPTGQGGTALQSMLNIGPKPLVPPAP